MAKNVLARFVTTDGAHAIELTETPKGLTEVGIDGHTLKARDAKELAQWLRMIYESPKDKNSD